jgi:hypothetical protein
MLSPSSSTGATHRSSWLSESFSSVPPTTRHRNESVVAHDSHRDRLRPHIRHGDAGGRPGRHRDASR